MSERVFVIGQTTVEIPYGFPECQFHIKSIFDEDWKCLLEASSVDSCMVTLSIQMRNVYEKSERIAMKYNHVVMSILWCYSINRGFHIDVMTNRLGMLSSILYIIVMIIEVQKSVCPHMIQY